MSDPMKTLIFAAALSFMTLSGAASAATCGNDASGFNTWKQQFAAEATNAGVGQRGLDALANTSYATRTISADRNQKSFKYILENLCGVQFNQHHLPKTKASIAAFFVSFEKKQSVPTGVIPAIHPMEVEYRRCMGDSIVISAITTLTYD